MCVCLSDWSQLHVLPISGSRIIIVFLLSLVLPQVLSKSLLAARSLIIVSLNITHALIKEKKNELLLLCLCPSVEVSTLVI